MKIGIIGLGFVGLSFASVLASKGYSIIGIDTDKEKLEKISNGIVPFHEPKLQLMLKRSLNFSISDLALSAYIKASLLPRDPIIIFLFFI